MYKGNYDGLARGFYRRVEEINFAVLYHPIM